MRAESNAKPGWFEKRWNEACWAFSALVSALHLMIGIVLMIAGGGTIYAAGGDANALVCGALIIGIAFGVWARGYRK